MDVENSAPARSAKDVAASRIGSVVDKYTLVRLLGQGGMGAVYEARHAKLARRVGIKFLLPELATNREVLRRFENEAKAAGGLEHPNLVAVTDVGTATDGAPYLVMEYLEGEDCSKLLRRMGPLPVPRATDIVVQACRGLAVAHRASIVHRDLKPENLFITDAGDGTDLLKVLDFGIAKLRPTDASVVTGTGATFGTAFYMSPEQARGAGDVDPRTDVWSLGVVLYELLTGRKPFQGEQFLQVIYQILSVEPPPASSVRPGLPAKLSEIIERAMVKEADDRLPSVLELAEVLLPFAGRTSNAQRVLSAEALAATRATPETRTGEARRAPSAAPGRSRAPSSPAVPAATPATRRRAAPRIVAALALAAAVIGGVAYWMARRAPATPERAEAAAMAPAPPPAPSSSSLSPQPAAVIAAPPPVAVPATPPPAAVAVPPATTVSRRSRIPSERSERGQERRPVPVAPVVPVAVAPAPPAVAPAAPTPKPAAPAGHPLDIEKDNPY